MGKGGAVQTRTDRNALLRQKRRRFLTVHPRPEGHRRCLMRPGEYLHSQFLQALGTPFQLTVLPADIRLAGAEIELANMERRERVIADMLEGVREQFDYIFIDCPPSLGMITLNALCAADGVLIPIQCEYFALEGVSALMGTIQKVQKMNRHLAIEGVVLTMLDARTNLGVQVAQEVRKVFKNKVYQTVIPRNVRLGEAPSHGLPISLYDPRSLGAQSYQQLAKEFLARE